MARNQIRCYVFIRDNNTPVRGAIVSCKRCSDGRIQNARTDIFGVATFNVPNGTYLVRCECVPNFLNPSMTDYCVELNPYACSADLLFPCPMASLNTNPINISPNINNVLPDLDTPPVTNSRPTITNNRPTTSTNNRPASNNSTPNNTSFINTPSNIANQIGITPSNTMSNSFFGSERTGFYPRNQPLPPTSPDLAEQLKSTQTPDNPSTTPENPTLNNDQSTPTE